MSALGLQPAQQPARIGTWPTAADAAIASARIKSHPADFKVVERPLPALAAGRTESAQSQSQRLLKLRKTGLNSPYVAALLARWANLAPVEVGYAGRKDRNAVTEQWFSLPEFAAARALEAVGGFAEFAAPQLGAGESLMLLDEAWQPRKLRIGELQGNDFEILLRELTPVGSPGWKGRLAAAFDALARNGAPNYFGSQRFGHDNLALARTWLQQQTDPERRTPRRGRKQRRHGSRHDQGGWQRSTLRSYLFNEVLAARVADASFHCALPGDVLDPDQGVPTGPLWGRGRSATTQAALAIEQDALAPHDALCSGLEHTGLTQQRRALVVFPENLSWEISDGALLVRFGLPRGAYATVLLAELFVLRGL